MNSLVASAKAFAWAAHAGQTRRFCGSPYICHPAHVAWLLEQAGEHDDDILAAAWLHDVVEDNWKITVLDIATLFGTEVAELVDQMTNPSTPMDGNRATRKAIDRDHMADASAKAKSIRLADIVSNCPSIIANDPGFAKIYIPEKALMLEVLSEGNPALMRQARTIVDDYMQREVRSE